MGAHKSYELHRNLCLISVGIQVNETLGQNIGEMTPTFNVLIIQEGILIGLPPDSAWVMVGCSRVIFEWEREAKCLLLLPTPPTGPR